MSRSFNRRQRIALWAISGGRCAQCGIELDPSDFHADHILPFSLGGATALSNGQALCVQCNLRKSNSMNYRDHLQPRGGKTPRRWQEKALEKFFSADNIAALASGEKPSFVLDAEPGAGKQFFAGSVAQVMLRSGLVDRVMVVVPTDPLRTQTGKSIAQDFGLSVYNDTGNPSPNCEVVVQTYQGLTSDAGWIIWSEAMNRQRWLVILDEFHHLSDNNTWGERVQQITAPVRYLLQMTGTLWRSSKGEELPRTTYRDVLGRPGQMEPVPDFEYTYPEALADGNVVRLVAFRTDDSQIRWLSTVGADPDEHGCAVPVEYTHSLSDDLNAIYRGKLRPRDIVKLTTQRRNHLLDPSGRWIKDRILDLHRSLRDARLTHRDAAGLFICKNQDHAERVCALVEQLTGQRALLVHDKVKDANELIRKFDRKVDGYGDYWYLVSVKMVSEGVDVKRLTHLAYFTVIQQQLSWKQMIGRVIRWQPDAPQNQIAVVYQPQYPELVRYAAELEKAARPYLEQRQEEEKLCSRCGKDPCICPPKDPDGKGGDQPLRHGSYLEEALVGEQSSIFRGNHLQGIELLRSMLGECRIPPEQVAEVLIGMQQRGVDINDLSKELRSQSHIVAPEVIPVWGNDLNTEEVLTTSEQLKLSRKKCNELASSVARAEQPRLVAGSDEYRSAMQLVHRDGNRHIGVNKQEYATEAQLAMKQIYLKTRLLNARTRSEVTQ